MSINPTKESSASAREAILRLSLDGNEKIEIELPKSFNERKVPLQSFSENAFLKDQSTHGLRDYGKNNSDLEDENLLEFDSEEKNSSVYQENNNSRMESWEFGAVIKAYEKVKGSSLSEEEVQRFAYELLKTANIDVGLSSVDKLAGKDAVAEIEKAAVIMRDELTPKLKSAKRSLDSQLSQKYEKEIHQLQKETLLKIGVSLTYEEAPKDIGSFDFYNKNFKALVSFGLTQAHIRHFSPKYFEAFRARVLRSGEDFADILPPAPAGKSAF